MVRCSRLLTDNCFHISHAVCFACRPAAQPLSHTGNECRFSTAESKDEHIRLTLPCAIGKVTLP